MDQDTDKLLVDVPVEVKDPGWNVDPNSRAIQQTVHWTVPLLTGWKLVTSGPDTGPRNTSVQLGYANYVSRHVEEYWKQSANFKVGNIDNYEAAIIMFLLYQSQTVRMSVYLNILEWKSSIIGTLIFDITDPKQSGLRIHKEVSICKDTHIPGRGWGIEDFLNQQPQLQYAQLIRRAVPARHVPPPQPPMSGRTGMGFGSANSAPVTEFAFQGFQFDVMLVKLTLRLEVEKIPVSVSPMKQHLDELASHFGSLYEGGSFSDVTLMVDGHPLRAHKAVLCARSPVFAAMLASDMEEAASNTVQIEDLRVEVVDKMLKFIYTGRVDGLGEVAEDLLTAADKYGLDSLKDLCAGWLAGNLTTLNVAQIFRQADLHSVAGLQKTAADFIKSNLKAVKVTDGWKSLKKSCPQLVIDTFI